MMRWLVLLLLLVNIALYAWNAGWLPAPLGVSTDGPREPQRLQRQVNAEAVRIVPETASLAAEAASEPASGVADAASEPAASAPGNGAAPAARTP
ncbi:hypothetical protein [Azohydromonas sediminis]|uniref:hypothetical protein n=1 Tax=Azohydromonas sediminis TaxID=2259674 RepID=UPI000E649443|nr:hypothetical protein [Azohydromonas sediminis]